MAVGNWREGLYQCESEEFKKQVLEGWRDHFSEAEIAMFGTKMMEYGYPTIDDAIVDAVYNTLHRIVEVDGIPELELGHIQLGLPSLEEWDAVMTPMVRG